jgi:hypothetical protein
LPKKKNKNTKLLKIKEKKNMFLKHRGDVTVEWVVTAAVVIVVIVAAIVSLLNQGGAQAGEMGNWVEGISVPAIP